MAAHGERRTQDAANPATQNAAAAASPSGSPTAAAAKEPRSTSAVSAGAATIAAQAPPAKPSGDGAGAHHRVPDPAPAAGERVRRDSGGNAGWNRFQYQGKSIAIVGDLYGQLHMIDDVIEAARGVDCVIAVGNFGFFDEHSGATTDDEVVRAYQKASAASKSSFPGAPASGSMRRSPIPGELQEYISGTRRFQVPVYVVWGEYEDIRVIEKFMSGEYKVHNLHLVDCETPVTIGNLCLFGLGGAWNRERLFDHGEARGASVGGGARGHMWITMLQIGRLLQTWSAFQRQEEHKLAFASHKCASLGGAPLLIAMHLAVDLCIGSGEGAYGALFSEPSVRDSEETKARFELAKAELYALYQQVRPQPSIEAPDVPLRVADGQRCGCCARHHDVAPGMIVR